VTAIKQKTIIIYFALILVFSSSIFSIIVSAQEEQQTAEIALRIDDTKIPNIAKNWTAIPLIVEDNFGLDWNRLQSYPKIITNIWWRIAFGIPEIERYLGYTSILFEPDEASVPEGWFVRFEPSTIDETTSNMSHKITMYARVTGLAAQYNPTIRLKCIRYDVLGDLYGITYATMPLKAVSLNYAFVNALESSKKAAPKTLVYFPIEVINEGEFIATYNFEIKDRHETNSLISNQVLVLNPGEKKTVELGVLTPEIFFDTGTPRRIDIVLYPAGSPSEKFETSVIVITEGFYISPIIGLILAPILLIIIIIYLIFIYLKQKKEQKIYGKPPAKPWTLPEKKQYLKELIKKDEELYKKEMEKLKGEYNSALEAYKQELANKKQEKKKNKQNVILKRKIIDKKKSEENKTVDKKKVKKNKEYKITSFFKKTDKREKPKKIKIEKQEIKKKSKEEPDKKEKLISQIKRDQSNQKRMNK